jgi:signal transduction histidine kinase
LHNFVSNAIKYSPDGGEVRIIARLKPADDEFPYDSVVIGVKDQGMGIPVKSLKRSGHTFIRSHGSGTRKAGGTGIGLYLVRNIIAAHKGQMIVESEVGKGSTFWCRLPLRQPTEAKTVQEHLEAFPMVVRMPCQ